MVNKKTDILIIGGGLIGATLMLALQGLGFSALLVDSQAFVDKTNPDFDARSLALSPASQRILSMLGVWDILKEYACPIEKIHVSEQGHFGMSRLLGNESNPLGYVVEMHYINLALHQLLDTNQLIAPATLTALDLQKQMATVTTESGEMHIHAKLIIAADGAQSAARGFAAMPSETKQYHQQALVTNVGLVKPHNQCAYERFTPHGPLALLPMPGHRMSLVWAMTPENAQLMMNISEADFLKKLHLAFGYRLGRLVKVGKRFSYPLKQVIMPQITNWPIVFVGNAAHTLHPVAGQGFNLGLRDVATLAQCIAKQGLNEQMLSEYLQLRLHDQQMITLFTDSLVQLFTSRLPGVSTLRNLGLLAFDNSPILKTLLARYARGFGGVIPDLVCEMALRREHEPIL